MTETMMGMSGVCCGGYGWVRYNICGKHLDKLLSHISKFFITNMKHLEAAVLNARLGYFKATAWHDCLEVDQ